MDRLGALFDDERQEEAWRRLYSLAQETDDYARFSSLLRWRRKLTAAGPRPGTRRNVKLALLGSATTDLLADPIALAIEATGLDCTLHQAPFNTFAQEMLVADSATVSFAPDVAVVVTTPAAIPEWSAPDDGQDRVAEIAERGADHFAGLCRTLHQNCGCDIVINNFHRLPSRPLGTAGTRMPGAPNNFIDSLNRALATRLPEYAHLHDVDALAAEHGLLNWFDPRFWFHAKQPVSFDCLVPFAHGIARIVGAMFGRASKCVVLDLDNTLWGGIVGDDGPEGLVIGEGHPLGEAFKALQEYLRILKERGILLAVCSKNEMENALAPFRTRREMVLRETDFVAFIANWTPKSENLREIARRLNIGIDSLVLVDDNPAEREQVRQAEPDVRVVELPDDPAGYVRALDRTGWLDAVGISAEDRRRNRTYRDNLEREALRASSTDYVGYLRSLRQRAVIAPFDHAHLQRITQLTNKTNQFNLTTRRMTESEIEQAADSPDHLTAYVRLADRFGDNGLISVFIAQRNGKGLRIDNWLMSCRVFGRGVERLLFNWVAEEAQRMGAAYIHGTYLPTPRNGLVREHYPSLGFSPVEETGAEGRSYRLDLEAHRPFDVEIELVDEY